MIKKYFTEFSTSRERERGGELMREQSRYDNGHSQCTVYNCMKMSLWNTIWNTILLTRDITMKLLNIKDSFC